MVENQKNQLSKELFKRLTETELGKIEKITREQIFKALEVGRKNRIRAEANTRTTPVRSQLRFK